jgi:ribosomal protein S18 acetylase RimI-like enzyme
MVLQMETVLFNENGDESEAQYIRDQLKEFNNSVVGDDNHKQIYIIAKKDDQIIGGIIGGTYWGWLYIDRFWVQENYRNRGLGKRLLEKMENEGRKRNCRYVHLDTHDFQAVGFYKKQGYDIKCEIDDLPKGHKKYLMIKQLS